MGKLGGKEKRKSEGEKWGKKKNEVKKNDTSEAREKKIKEKSEGKERKR